MSTSTSVLICQMGMMATLAAEFEVEAVRQAKGFATKFTIYRKSLVSVSYLPAEILIPDTLRMMRIKPSTHYKWNLFWRCIFIFHYVDACMSVWGYVHQRAIAYGGDIGSPMARVRGGFEPTGASTICALTAESPFQPGYQALGLQKLYTFQVSTRGEKCLIQGMLNKYLLKEEKVNGAMNGSYSSCYLGREEGLLNRGMALRGSPYSMAHQFATFLQRGREERF